MKIKIDKIKVGNRYRKDLGDIQQLAESMDNIGLLHPVVIDQANNLVAGQRRLEAAKLLEWTGIDCRVVDIPAILLGERDENAIRKPFAPTEMVAIKRATIDYEKKAAKQRQGTRTDLELVEKFTTSKKVRAKDKLTAINEYNHMNEFVGCIFSATNFQEMLECLKT
jgi:hypothetical protein